MPLFEAGDFSEHGIERGVLLFVLTFGMYWTGTASNSLGRRRCLPSRCDPVRARHKTVELSRRPIEHAKPRKRRIWRRAFHKAQEDDRCPRADNDRKDRGVDQLSFIFTFLMLAWGTKPSLRRNRVCSGECGYEDGSQKKGPEVLKAAMQQSDWSGMLDRLKLDVVTVMHDLPAVL